MGFLVPKVDPYLTIDIPGTEKRMVMRHILLTSYGQEASNSDPSVKNSKGIKVE